MDLLREIARVVRQLLHQRSFAAAAIVTLALGIAAPTTLFTIVHATLLRPLPYPRAGDIYTVRTTMTDGRFTSGLVATEELNALTRATGAVASSAYSVRFDDTIQTTAQLKQVAAYGVSQQFFDLFGLPMAAGRGFTAEDFAAAGQATPGTMRRVVLSHQLWTSMFGADSSVIGSTVRLAAMGPALIVGVAGPTFDMPHGAELWFGYPLPENIGHGLVGYVRLQPGTAIASLDGPGARVFLDLTKKYPDMEDHRAFVMKSLVTELVGDLGPTVVIAFAATGLLLLLALFNVANLLIARGAARARDMAVRTALGASRWQLIRQLLIESLVISAAASVIALALASAAVRVIVAVGGSRLPRVDGMTLNPMVFAFAAGVMIVAGLLVGLIPAVTVADGRLASLMNEGGRAGLQGRTTRRWLDVMVVAEVTLAIALVAGAGRLILSLGNLLSVDPGFSSQGRLAVDVLLPREYRDVERLAAWSADADAALRSLGATHVGVASSLPMRREWDSTLFTDIVGRPTEPRYRPNARERIVNPDFFAALGIKTLVGRTFTAADQRDSAPVVVINDAWRRRFVPNLDPLRERIATGLFNRPGRPEGPGGAEIIGVVADVQFTDVMQPAEPTLYLVDAQLPLWRRSFVVTTADGHPERLTSEIRAALTRLDANVPIDIALMSSSESPSLVWSRLGLFLMGTCGVIAICLAWVGVFGVVAYAVTQRTGEMAVRLALGATRSKVFALVMGHGARLATIGLFVGVALAWWLGQLMARYVYHVGAANLAVLGGSAALIMIVSIAAMLPPARRASAVKPGRVFRA
ncbi:MAG TPA: FtsX-like permease family protein [Vicinamibacterales bacterium]|nr:FtsX-like permease family protein [Vicinamibacterales bacterium]